MNRRELRHLVMGSIVLALFAVAVSLLTVSADESLYLRDFFTDNHGQKPQRVAHYRLECRGPASFGASALVTWTPSGDVAVQALCNNNYVINGQLTVPEGATDLHVSLFVADSASGMTNTCTGDVPPGTGPGQFDHPQGWLKSVTCTLSPTEATLTISIPQLYLPAIVKG